MGRLTGRPVLRGLAMALCIVCVVAAFWSGAVVVGRWDDLWSGGSFYESGSIHSVHWEKVGLLQDGIELRLEKEWGRPLDYLTQNRLEEIEASLDRERTNLRFRVLDEAGNVLWSNAAAGELERTADRLSGGYYYGWNPLSDQDKIYWLEREERYRILRVQTEAGPVEYRPSDEEETAEYAQYGYTYNFNNAAWSYDPELDIRGHRAGVVLESGVVRPLTAADEFQTAKEAYEEIQGWLTPLLAVAVAALTGAAVLLIWLCSGVGAEPDGTASLRGQDRIPLECYLMLQAVAFSVLRSAGDPILFYLNGGSGGVRLVVGLGTLSVAGAGLVLALCLTLAARVRSRMLLKNTLCWRLWAAVTGWAARTARHWPVTRRAVWAFALYLTGTFVTSFTVVLIPIYQGAVLWAVCRWVRQWSAIRAATAQIVGGGPEVKIDTRGMFWDLRTHAEQLNDLGQAITNAVEGRLKSERFKTELITNVSHDLKTPLTSIINYVDLMKKEDIQNPKAKEYLEVLERKSQRLKKLTEDLVEASKASSGSLPVNLARLEFGQLLRQAMGEYEEKFQQAGLTAVIGGADSSTAVLADGRHLWRVIDNLLGNCCKYALPGTRVYLDLERDGEMVVLAVKNISQNPLNIPPEQLMERFVRGEASRTTEGSGLGLSIARSLTELQHGTFRLSIDGDLFKAAVAMPACPAEPPALPAAEI